MKFPRVKQVMGRLLRVGSVGTNHVPARAAWIAQTLRNIPSGQRILDAGAGELQFKKHCNHLKYVAQDFAQYDGRGDGRGLTTGSWDQSRLDIVSDIASIPEPDESFDAIMCIEVFEHLPNPVLAIQEFARLLRPGGQLIITAPLATSGRRILETASQPIRIAITTSDTALASAANTPTRWYPKVIP